ncbi:MAG: hypothetical protein ACOX52_08205 [Verrucomicrobiota bacterium]
MEPTHPDRLLENVTAPSAGGFPGPDGEVRLRMRLPFRTGSSQMGSSPDCAAFQCSPPASSV